MLCRRWWGAKGKRLDQECLLASRRRQPTGSWSDHCVNATDAGGDDEVFHVHQVLPGPGSLFYLEADDCCTDASTSDSNPGILVGEEARLEAYGKTGREKENLRKNTLENIERRKAEERSPETVS